MISKEYKDRNNFKKTIPKDIIILINSFYGYVFIKWYKKKIDMLKEYYPINIYPIKNHRF